MDINDKITEVKIRLKELTKHFPYTEFEISMLTIIYIAIASIDNDITDILDEALSSNFILLNNGKFDGIFTDMGLAPRSVEAFYKNAGFNLTSKDNYTFINISTLSLKQYGRTDIVYLFENIIHELKHAMNSIVNGFMMEPGKSIMYYGLDKDVCDGKNYKSYYNILDEVFNDFITKIYLEQILELKSMPITDPGIHEILKNFAMPEKYSYSYNATSLWEDLFNDQIWFTLFYNAALFRDYEPLINELQKLFTKDLKNRNIASSEILEFLDKITNKYQKYFKKNVANYFDRTLTKYPVRKLTIKPYYEKI